MQSFKFLLMCVSCLFSTFCNASWTISQPNFISESYSYTYGAVYPSCDPATGNYLATWVDMNNNSIPTYAFFTPDSGWSPFITFPGSSSALLVSNVISSCNPAAGQFLASWTSFIAGSPAYQYPTISLYNPGSGWSSASSLLSSQATHNTANAFSSTTGQFLVTWADANNSNSPTYAFFDPNSGWGSVGVISNSSPTTDVYTCYNPATDQFLAVWTDNNSGAVTYSFYAAGSWSPISTLPDSSVNANVFCACKPASGQFIATWNDINQSLHPYYSVYTPGSGWSPMCPITTSLSVNGNVTLSCDSNKGEYLALWSSSIPNGNLTYSFYNSESGWTQPQFISDIASTNGDIFSAFNSSANQFLTSWPDNSNADLVFDPSYSFFTRVAPPNLPLITSITPSFGLKSSDKKTHVTINGENFIGAISVLFGSIPAVEIIGESSTTIRVIPPRGHGTVDVRVISSAGCSLNTPNDLYTYIPSPPRKLRGKREKSVHNGQIILHNIINWKAPSHGLPIVYRIYRDALLRNLAGEVTSRHPLRFSDEVQSNRRKKSMTYYVVSVNSHGIQSLPVKTTIPWRN